MNKKKYLSAFFVSIFVVLIISCKDQGEQFISRRNPTQYIMRNIHNAYLHLSSYNDSILYTGIHYAEIKGNIFNINDSVSVTSYGHCYSLENKEPTASDLKTTVKLSQNNDFSFTSELEDLTIDTLYYIRSYAVVKYNSGLIDTAYNPTVSKFRTRLPEDIWFAKNFFNQGRYEATSFVFKNEAYIACGYDGVKLLNDIWKYNMNDDTWEQVAKLGGGTGKPRMSAVSFTLQDSVYIGTGIIDEHTNKYSNDMWRWSPNYNTWTEINSLGINEERANAIAFTLEVTDPGYGLEQRAYVGLGITNYPRDDIKSYNFRADTAGADPGAAWPTINQFLGGGRTEACVAVVENRAIVGAGLDIDNEYHKDFYIFDPTSGDYGRWTGVIQIPDSIDCPPRANAVSFALSFERDNGDKHNVFYFGTGRSSSGLLNDWYGYDINQRYWKRCTKIREDKNIADAREGAIAFSIKRNHVEFGTLQRGFVGLGKTVKPTGVTPIRDVWEYLP